MNSELTTLLFVAVLFIVIIFFFIKVALRIRKHGGSMTTIMHAATYEFLSKDMRESSKEVVEIKANKKTEEEASDKPELDEQIFFARKIK